MAEESNKEIPEVQEVPEISEEITPNEYIKNKEMLAREQALEDRSKTVDELLKKLEKAGALPEIVSRNKSGIPRKTRTVKIKPRNLEKEKREKLEEEIAQLKNQIAEEEKEEKPIIKPVEVKPIIKPIEVKPERLSLREKMDMRRRR